MDNIYELWTAVMQELSGSVSTAIMSTWIKTLVPISFDAECLVLETSSGFKKDIIDRRFKEEIPECEIGLTAPGVKSEMNLPEF